MSETTGTPSTETVHEAYAFACMRCGHGWEQSYEIRHHIDEAGRISVTYHVGSRRVPSPLTRPTCQNCGAHVVRIMRPGRVAGARWEWAGSRRRRHSGPDADPALPQGDRAYDAPAAGPLPAEPSPHHQHRQHHHWRLADLLHLFHLHGRHHGEHARDGQHGQQSGDGTAA